MKQAKIALFVALVHLFTPSTTFAMSTAVAFLALLTPCLEGDARILGSYTYCEGARRQCSNWIGTVYGQVQSACLQDAHCRNDMIQAILNVDLTSIPDANPGEAIRNETLAAIQEAIEGRNCSSLEIDEAFKPSKAFAEGLKAGTARFGTKSRCARKSYIKNCTQRFFDRVEDFENIRSLEKTCKERVYLSVESMSLSQVGWHIGYNDFEAERESSRNDDEKEMIRANILRNVEQEFNQSSCLSKTSICQKNASSVNQPSLVILFCGLGLLGSQLSLEDSDEE